MKAAIARIGYSGLSMVVLLSQRLEVMALDIRLSKVEMINHRHSP